MPFLAPNLNNYVPRFALVITPSFHLHHVEVAEQNPASGSIYAEIYRIISYLFFERFSEISIGKLSVLFFEI